MLFFARFYAVRLLSYKFSSKIKEHDAQQIEMEMENFQGYGDLQNQRYAVRRTLWPFATLTARPQT